MAHDKGKIFNKSKQLATERNLFFIEDIVSLLPISKTTFYDYFPPDSNELNELKEILGNNHVNLKVKLRKKWEDSTAPALQMALMKLVSNQEELRRLSTTYTEVEIDKDKMLGTGKIEL